jgi:hypothetical protein
MANERIVNHIADHLIRGERADATALTNTLTIATIGQLPAFKEGGPFATVLAAETKMWQQIIDAEARRSKGTEPICLAKIVDGTSTSPAHIEFIDNEKASKKCWADH